MPTSRLKRSLRTTFLGLATNAVLAAAKMLAGIFGHSHALIADAVESMADVFSSIVVWRGVVVAAAPPDEDHPYGHGKAEPLAAAVVSTMLLLAAIWIVTAAFSGIAEPHPAPKPFTLLVLMVVIFVKEGLFRFALHEAISVDSAVVATDAWHHRSDVITSLAAAIGITVALVGGKGFEAADDWAAIAAACVIGWNGWRLLRPAMNELMDSSPNREVVDRIRIVAEAVPGVARVEKCLVRKMGYQYFVDMHVEVDPQMTVLRSHEIAHTVKDNVRAQVPQVRDVLIHIEPSK
jgi:cation diffusion facilitator family transporter